MSKEPLDSNKIKEFCSSIESNLKPTIQELEKLKGEIKGNNILYFPGIINTVNKDFFVSESEVSYLDYEKSFSEMFKENLKMKLGYAIQQSTISNHTLNSNNIKRIINELKSKIIVINFGVSEIEGIEDDNIIQLGRTYNVTPRIFLFIKDNDSSMSTSFNLPELSQDYSNKHPILENNVIIGVEKLSSGLLAERFNEAISPDVDLENTVGIEIGSNINMTVSDSFKSICLIEHQKYRDSKDPDELSAIEIIELIR